MLPKAYLMRSAPAFRRTVRTGVRAGRPTLVVSAVRAEPQVGSDPQGRGVRIGFVVSKAVGNAVTRNRVKRRLRHFSRPLLEDLPTDTWVVVRALPSAGQPDAPLEQDLAGAWRTCLKKLEQRP